MTDEEYFDPSFIDVHYLEGILNNLKISYNFNNNTLDQYIYGIDEDLLYSKDPITEKDIKFRSLKISKEIKEEIIILLNDLREINMESEED